MFAISTFLWELHCFHSVCLIQYLIKDLEENPAPDVITSNGLNYAPEGGNERNIQNDLPQLLR